MHIAHRVQQFGHLLLAGADDARVRVARRRDAERGRQVEILFAFRVPDVNASAPAPRRSAMSRPVR